MISIITPIFNGENYIKHLNESICAQKYQDYEWIIVDDGSSDNSYKILNEIKNENKKIKVLHQKNQGVSSARNLGLNFATGEWICFLDIDDDVDPCWLYNYYMASKDGCDIIFQGAIINNETFKSDFQLKDCIYNNLKDFVYIWQTKQGHIGSAWSKMIKSSIIRKHNIRFDTHINNFEDWVFLTECLSEAKSIKTISAKSYIYNHQNSKLTGCNAKSYDISSYFTIFQARYCAVQKLREKNFGCYKIMLIKITDLLLQGIKEIYKQNKKIPKTDRIEILVHYSKYDLSFKGISLKNKIIYILFKIENKNISNLLLKLLLSIYPSNI